jgi:hypothetical protein
MSASFRGQEQPEHRLDGIVGAALALALGSGRVVSYFDAGAHQLSL